MKNVFITGSTDGIGKLAALQFAREGNTVILHGRNSAKLQRTIEEVKQSSQNKAIHGFVADFSDLSSVRNLVSNVSETFPSIDVLINNAGVFKSSDALNDQKLDVRFVVNYLAPYILTKGMMPLLKNGNSPRIVNLSSAAQASISFQALKGHEMLSESNAYAQSKLALTIWSFYLAEQNPELNIIALNPGSLLNTKMVKEAYGRFWSSAEKGSNIIYEAATSERFMEGSGRYFDNDIEAFNEAHEDAYDSIIQDRLIAETERILNI